MTNGISAEATNYANFDAVTITRSGSFELDLAPDSVFPLFTAPGEKLWVPGWDPHILHGDGYEAGTVWVTTGDGKTVCWYVAAYDTDVRRAKYVRVTPTEHVGTVEVYVSALENNRSKASVTYQLTGLSETGNAYLTASFSETSYAEMMQEWRDAIAGGEYSVK
ncbi:MAG: hypothetical protein AAFM91_19050 [Pseudomonadota bacterium]